MLYFRPAFIPTLFFVLLSGLAVSLGVWQISRGTEKRDLLDRLEKRLTAPPTALPALFLRSAGDKDAFEGKKDALSLLKDFEFSQINETGAFLKEPFFFAPSIRKEKRGFNFIGAIKISPDFVLPVDFGFIPGEIKTVREKMTPLLNRAGKSVTVHGTLRLPERYDDTPASGEITAGLPFRSFAALYNEKLIPAYLTAGSKTRLGDGFPEGKDGRSLIDNIQNNHATYTVTWFGLAAILFVVYIYWHKQEGRLRI